jgi:hypothetical protein
MRMIPQRSRRASEKSIFSVAFVLLSGKDAKLIDLDDAKPIDETATAWREHIDQFKPSLAPVKVRELVWDKEAAAVETKQFQVAPAARYNDRGSP